MLKLRTLLLLYCLTFVNCENLSESVEDRIHHSEGLSRVDNLCSSLPVPAGFIFVSKNIKGNSLKYDVGYLFSAKVDFASVEKFYADWGLKNDWDKDASNSYSDQFYFTYVKDKQIIFIQQVGFSEANYVVRCQEWV